MKNIFKLLLACAFVFSLATPLLAKDPKTEDEVMTALNSTNAKVVFNALLVMEKKYPTSAPGLAKAKSLLTDDRATVREKAARVLGALHADLSDDDLKKISAMLDSSDPKEVQQALLALRGLEAKSTIPKILPALKNADPFVKRDACRTLAVLGDKSVIPDIQPLTQDPDPKVQTDANDAIFALKNK